MSSISHAEWLKSGRERVRERDAHRVLPPGLLD